MFYPSGCDKEGRDITMNKKYREPVVAGTFYPADPDTLRAMLEELFKKTKRIDFKGDIIGIIAPHAGYPYSGEIAAKAYRQLEGKQFDTVILIGPSHRAAFNAASVYKEGGWKTPLGMVPINESLSKKLIDADDLLEYYPQGHLQEHSLEVQIPFLQTVLDNFTIVPIIMGNQNPQLCDRLADALVSVVRNENILLVASTDLYHGYSYNDCYASDSLVLKTIGAFDIDGFKDLFTSNENVGCGAGPVYTVLRAARTMGASTSVLIEHTTSGDVTGDKTGYIVGYVSYIITRDGSNPGNEEILSKEEKVFLLDVARNSLQAAVQGKPVPKIEPLTERLNEPKGVFVTLTMQGMLRGCIGFIQAVKPLIESVSEMAISAALNDPRFPPVSKEEIDELHIEISVLTPLKKIDDPEIIEIGKHGIYIRKDIFSGLLLPQVATEQGWNRKIFLEQTCRKAGLPPNAYKEPDTDIFIFQALIFNEDDLKH